MAIVIPNFHGTTTHRTGAEIFQRHTHNSHGACAYCGQRFPCYPHASALQVLQAAGDDPRRYDMTQPRYDGYAYGTRAQQGNTEALSYQREA